MTSTHNGNGAGGGRDGGGSGRRRRRRRRSGRGRRGGGAVKGHRPQAGNGRRSSRRGAPAAAKRGSPAKRQTPRARHEHSAGGVVVRVTEGAPLFLLIRDSYGHWGFPKGHLERGERADTAAVREVMEETGLAAVSLVGSIATIDWYFRFRGALIHKNCEFFLMLTSAETTKPQRSEGITACRWTTLDDARRLIAYANARAVLQRAGEMLDARAHAGVALASHGDEP